MVTAVAAGSPEPGFRAYLGWAPELTWTLIPLAIALFIFVWGARLYLSWARPPDDALEIYVVAKQWMWKVQHLGGEREINQLHVPLGRPVKLTLISQDVIHSFFVPAFRIHQDVLPNRYTTVWFEPTKAGERPQMKVLLERLKAKQPGAVCGREARL